MNRPAIEPMPPFATGVGLPWDVAVADAVAAIATARAEHGDTFVVDSGPDADRYLFTFSPVGVASFYALPEERASKGLADFRMLRRKLPDEIFVGRRVLPSQLFRRDDVASYLANLDRALEVTVDELGAAGTVDLFALTRRLGHRMGLASWAGPGCAEGADFDALVVAFDALDGSDAFVHPGAMADVAAGGKERECAALERVVDVVGDSIRRDVSAHPLFARIVDAWARADDPARGIALDVALIHVASMSNLAAALGWLLVDLITHPDAAHRVRAGDRAFAEQCALESTRLAQRSIMARFVHNPVQFATEDTTYAVAPGVTLATLLPLTNPLAGTEWDPQRWQRHRLIPPLSAPQLVTSFGHGKHSCPAQPFSLAAMSSAAVHLLGSYEFEPGWQRYPVPVPAQIGGVARAAGAVPAGYGRRRPA